MSSTPFLSLIHHHPDPRPLLRSGSLRSWIGQQASTFKLRSHHTRRGKQRRKWTRRIVVRDPQRLALLRSKNTRTTAVVTTKPAAGVHATTAGSWGWTPPFPPGASGMKSGRNTPAPGHRRPPSRPSTPSVPRRQPRIQVASLLADPNTRFYHLEVVQHPIKAAAFEDNVLSRLALTPPLIVRLTVRDPSGNPVLPDDELPFLIAHLSLLDERGITAVDAGSLLGGGPTAHMLYGNLVSVIEHPLEDLQGNLGLFFLFPDVSVRLRGNFQLRITLVRISSSVDSVTGAVSLARQGTVLAETRTRTFEVVHYTEYSAIPQTRLTQSFIRQGARMLPYS